MNTTYKASILCLALLAVGCTSTPMTPAPVVERSVNALPTPTSPASSASLPVQRPVVVTPTTAPNNAAVPRPTTLVDGKNHTVKKGDTLYSIALENGLSYRELADWNGITNPSYIQIEQVLRLTAPSAAVPVAIATPGAQASPVVMPSASGSSSTAVVSPIPVASASPSVKPPVLTAAGDIVWQWPVKGKVSTAFVEGKSKGVDIPGSMGEPIVAAADGVVVYGGSALKGYGQMLIVKHSEVFLTAYAHNSRLLVKEDQVVKRGQKIAEMGNSESDNGQTKLHFELRRSGKPIDPTKTLPAQ